MEMLPAFRISAVDGDKWVAWRSAFLILLEERPRYSLVRRLGGPHSRPVLVGDTGGDRTPVPSPARSWLCFFVYMTSEFNLMNMLALVNT